MTTKLASDRHVEWHTLFLHERERLLAALPHVTDGGVVERLQHIGATAVPGMPAVPCVDIGLSVSPFPLASPQVDLLAGLNYTLVSNDEDASTQRFRHRTQPIQLWATEAGSEAALVWELTRSFLQADAVACRHFAAEKLQLARRANYAGHKPAFFGALLMQARQWWVDHHGFGPLRQTVEELADYPHPWWISSGWAIDLFLGRVTRVHHDVDVVMPRIHQLDLQAHLLERGWRFVTPLDGRLEPWPRHMRIELPRHQVHAHRQGDFIDFLFTDIEHGVWRYRREPFVVQSVARMQLHSAEGIPFLAPELVLLFKSRNTSRQERSKDQEDFDLVLPHLNAERRAWLRWALLTQSPDHPWLARL
jgi:GrpB-like predicted nucleotidyltransferase (UPF0157 family)